MRKLLGDWIHPLLAGLATALLPGPERERLGREHGVDPPRWSCAVGALELCAGAALFLAGGLAFAAGQSTRLALGLLESWPADLSTTHIQAGGLIGWLAWLLHPAAWLYAALALVGLVRVVAFVATREAVAEPLVWAAVRAAGAWDARRFRKERERRLGPLRPDRVIRSSEGAEIVVISCRDKPDWREEVTLEIEHRFYRLAEVRDHADAEGEALAYVLREIEPSGLIRRLVRYRPPTPRGGGAEPQER